MCQSEFYFLSQYEASFVSQLYGGGNVSRDIFQNSQHTNASHMKSSCAAVDILCQLNAPFSSRNGVWNHNIQRNVKQDMSEFVVS